MSPNDVILATQDVSKPTKKRIASSRAGSTMNPRVKLPLLSKLIFDERNANRSTERVRVMLESLLRRLGAGRSVLVDQKGRIIAGNKTIEQARKLDMKKITVVETDADTLVAVQRKALDLKGTRKP